MTVEAGTLTAARPRSATYAGLALVTFATLIYEIGLTRIFSATMHYHFAFVAISVALFGMTAGALLVYLLPSRFPVTGAKQQLWVFSLLFAVAVPVSLVVQLRLPWTPDWGFDGVAAMSVICLVISVPFIFSGVVVCLALTRFPEQVSRLYAADLIGAAVGCVGFVVLLRYLDGPSAVMAIGALGALGGVLFASDASSKRGALLAVGAVVLVGGLAVTNGVLHESGDQFVKVLYARGRVDPPHRYEDWNNFSRVTIYGDPNVKSSAFGWSMSPTLPPTQAKQLTMSIDTAAGTVLTRYRGDPKQTEYLRYDLTNLAHYARPNADVLVVGVGGGRDVLSALQFDQRSVTGVELNGDILKLTNGKYGDFTGHLDRDPRVKFVNDEARSYLTRTDKKYDLIQISLIDTWAATAAGAYALSENTLYTTDAFKVYFDRLKPGGILSISRWYKIGNLQPLETLRLTGLAAQSLKNDGVANPRDHILAYRGGPPGLSTATLLISPQPFSPATLARLEGVSTQMQFTPLLTPTVATDRRMADLTVRSGPGAEINRFAEDLSPPTDRRPFFFQMADLNTFLSGRGFHQDFVTRPVLVLATLGLAVILLALGLIGVPLLITARRSRRGTHTGMASFYLYFAGIGFGYLLVEVSELQRLSIFLGHPTYALTVVLFSLLLASGIGSMLAGRFSLAGSRTRAVAPLVALLGVLVLFALVQPAVLHSARGETTPVRIFTAVAILVPLGLMMGMPFSIGMRTATLTRADPPTPFFWGINGATSVCASVLGMVLAVFFGLAASFWVGVAAYVLAAAALWGATSRRTPVTADAPAEATPAPVTAPASVPVPGA